MMGHDLPLIAYEPDDPPRPGALRVLDVPLGAPCVAGRLDTANARHVLALLDRAIDGARSGEFAAMVTAPVQKSVINDAGVPFTGHTEYLAARTQTRHPVMLLAADSLRVALATTHLPLRAVSDAITPELLDHHARHRARRRAAAVGHLAPAHRGLRPESARRRKRPPRHRGS